MDVAHNEVQPLSIAGTEPFARLLWLRSFACHRSRGRAPCDLTFAGFRSNYRPDVTMNHVHFTSLVNGADLAAEVAAALAGGFAAPHVYEVAPTGPFEDDPNVTDTPAPQPVVL